MAKIFEYAVIFNPKATKDVNGNDTTLPSELLVPVTVVLAKDAAEVQLRAARAIPDAYTDKLDQVEIAVRPF